MINARENMRRVITGDGEPEWMPVCSEDFKICFSSGFHERPEFGKSGFDWFGVRWAFDKTFMSFVQDSAYPPVCDDITKWEEQVKFPDYSQYDWKAAAERDLKCIGSLYCRIKSNLWMYAMSLEYII